MGEVAVTMVAFLGEMDSIVISKTLNNKGIQKMVLVRVGVEQW